MKYQIRAFSDSDINDIVELSLLAWKPIFQSFSQILGTNIYRSLYPDWERSQKGSVESMCRDRKKYRTIVAQYNEKVVGFLVYELIDSEKKGEVILLAVHPDYQNNNIGTDLNMKALEDMMLSGMEMAVVVTGNDETHAPARKAYEKVGYVGLPIVRYFKKL